MAEAAEGEPKTDAFGQEEGTPQLPKKEDEGGEGGKKYDAIPEDHPTIAALRQQIDDVKKEYGGNLAGQREVIKKLEATIESLKAGNGTGGGEGDDANVLFKDIKWSKDLTKEEREEMTDTEIRQMDEIAEMKVAQNKLYATQLAGGKKEGEAQQTNLQGWVKTEATALANGDIDMANKIIEAAKMLQLEGLDEATVKERVKMAAGMVPTYKPPKEQGGKKGGTVDGGGGTKEDPFGVNQVVKDVQAKRTQGGNYNL